MQVVLLERISTLGHIGQVVNVKPGYARNFLLPKQKALRATEENLAYFEKERAQIEAKNIKFKKEAESIASRYADTQVIIIRQASDMGHLYGSVRSQDIAEVLKDKGLDIKRTQIQIKTPIKVIGEHMISISLHPEVDLPVNVLIAQSKEEAAAIINKNAEEETDENA